MVVTWNCQRYQRCMKSIKKSWVWRSSWVGVQNCNLKERLQNTFGNQISFHQKAIGLPEIIYNTEKLNKVRLYDPIEIMKEAGQVIRKELLDYSEIYSEWPPTGTPKKQIWNALLCYIYIYITYHKAYIQRRSCLVYCQVTFLRQNEVQGLSTLQPRISYTTQAKAEKEFLNMCS